MIDQGADQFFITALTEISVRVAKNHYCLYLQYVIVSVVRNKHMNLYSRHGIYFKPNNEQSKMLLNQDKQWGFHKEVFI